MAKTKKKVEKWIKDKMHKAEDSITKSDLRSGEFYSLEYTSKLFYKGKLDFYDKQPVILALDKKGIYLLGLNFHYLPPRVRTNMLNLLKKRYPKEFETGKPLVNLTWRNIKSTLRFATYMIKLYRIPNISKAAKIRTDEVDNIIELRSEDFIGIDSQKVWSQMVGH